MINDNLKKIRKAKGIKQSFLAKKLGVSTMTYSRLERGESKLDVDRLQIIALILGVSVSIFFDDLAAESHVDNFTK